jgi:8-oxo-dGTP pyrophosphatase MutT (NUDIX family)
MPGSPGSPCAADLTAGTAVPLGRRDRRILWHPEQMRQPRSGDGFVLCSDGQMRWGLYGAAGVVFVTVANGDGPRVMLQLRSGWSHEGGTWSCPGGALEYGEDPIEGALREASEEVGVPTTRGRVLGQYVFDPAPEWRYTTVVVEIDEPFDLAMNFESEAVAWVPLNEVERYPLHPGFAAAWPHVRPIAARAGAG